MRRKAEKIVTLLVGMVMLGMVGVAIAQAASSPNVLDPSTWFGSADAITAIGVVLASYVVRISTALGKGWFQTDGERTRYLAMAIAVVIAGIGGYLSLGTFADVSGFAGALRAIVMVVLGYFGAVAKAEYDRQTFASGAERAEARLQSKLMRP